MFELSPRTEMNANLAEVLKETSLTLLHKDTYFFERNTLMYFFDCLYSYKIQN